MSINQGIGLHFQQLVLEHRVVRSGGALENICQCDKEKFGEKINFDLQQLKKINVVLIQSGLHVDLEKRLIHVSSRFGQSRHLKGAKKQKTKKKKLQKVDQLQLLLESINGDIYVCR